MTIGITGATGGVGSRVLHHLLARADSAPVVALARRPSALPDLPRLTFRRADYDEPSSLRDAFAGLRTLVFISSDGEGAVMRRHHENVVAAAIHAGVDHLVYTSIIDVSPDSGFYYSPIHRDTEAQIAASGIRHCFARTSIFAEFFTSTWLAPALRDQTLALPAGAGRMSLLCRDDVARAVAAAAATGREGIVDLTGPQALTAAEICEVTASETGRPLRYLDLEPADYRLQLADDGEPGWLISAFSSMFGSVREGRFALVSADIPRLTGVPQRSYADFIRTTALEPAASPSPRRS